MWTTLTAEPGFLLAPVVWSGLCALVLWLIVLASRGRAAWSERGGFRIDAMALFFFAGLLGSTVGITTGLSRQSAVAAVVPGVLTLMGILVGYVFSTRPASPTAIPSIILFAAIGLTFFFFFGVIAGSRARGASEDYSHQMELQKLEYAAALEMQRACYTATLDVWKGIQLWSGRGVPKVNIDQLLERCTPPSSSK